MRGRSGWGLLLGLASLAFLVASVDARAQEALPLPSAETTDEQRDPLAGEMNLEAIHARLEQARAQAKDDDAQETDGSEGGKRRSQWKRVGELLEMQVDRLESHQGDFAPESIEPPEGSPPYSITYLDHVRQKYRGFRESHELVQQENEAAQHRIEVAETAYTDAAQALHQLEEQGAATADRQEAELAVKIAKEAFIAARLDARLIDRKLKQARRNIDQWASWLPKVEADVAFSKDDHAIYLANIDEREQVLKSALVKIQQALWKERLKPDDARVYLKRLEALRDLLNEAIAYLPKERTIWQERRALHLGQADPQEIIDWKQQAVLEKQGLEKLVEVKKLRTQGQKRVADADEAVGEEAVGEDVELEKEILLRRELAFDSLHSLDLLLDTHIADLDYRQDERQVFYLKERIVHIFNALWSFEIAVIQDRTITVGKIVQAIGFFVVAVFLSRLLFVKLLYAILSRLHMREGFSFMVSSLLHYLVVFILLFVAISSAGIPLAVFALFGGALAIAAGFGSQKILNNFLSGIILLVERSIRVGDMIEVNETQGRVKKIGLRSVHVTTFCNVDIIVPNSKFLEEDVINWTLESDIIKSDIPIRVGFDAAPDEVAGLLSQVAVDHPRVLSEPEPKVFLEDLNSDAGYLLFKVYYWLRMPNPQERLEVESDLRRAILRRFREQGIDLAAPAQDITLRKQEV